MTDAKTATINKPHIILIGNGTFLLFDSPIVPCITKSNKASINSSIVAPLLHRFYAFILHATGKGNAKKE